MCAAAAAAAAAARAHAPGGSPTPAVVINFCPALQLDCRGPVRSGYHIKAVLSAHNRTEIIMKFVHDTRQNGGMNYAK